MRKLQLASALLALTGSALAAVSAEEAKQLGGSELTVFGAEKAGNKDGMIPAYTGAGIKPHAEWNAKDPGRRPDPFGDKPLLTITAQNYMQHAERLSDFQKEMFKRYPDYKMNVFKTHRSMVFPKYVLDNTVKNATSCKTTDGGLQVTGCYGGVPFPIPKTGNEVMWNHITFYGTVANYENQRTWHVPANGNAFLASASKGVEQFPWYDPKRTGQIDGKEVIWQVRLDDYGPARAAGQKLVITDSVDMINVGRRAYQYLPGQRRVKLAPDLAYDTPSPTNGGVGTVDDAKLFLGALDRFNFKLVGKKEVFLAYNTHGMTDYKVCPEDKFTNTKHFPNPECMRWELHRVWVVESTLKAEFRHMYKKRVFYFDEDGYGAGLQESYDGSGKLFRAAYNTFYTYWEKDGGNDGSVVNLDFTTGAYVMQGTAGAPGAGFWPIEPKPSNFFSPEALAGEGIR